MTSLTTLLPVIERAYTAANDDAARLYRAVLNITNRKHTDRELVDAQLEHASACGRAIALGDVVVAMTRAANGFDPVTGRVTEGSE